MLRSQYHTVPLCTVLLTARLLAELRILLKSFPKALMLVQMLQEYFEEGNTTEKLKSRPTFDQKYMNIFAGPSLLPYREDHVN